MLHTQHTHTNTSIRGRSMWRIHIYMENKLKIMRIHLYIGLSGLFNGNPSKSTAIMIAGGGGGAPPPVDQVEGVED